MIEQLSEHAQTVSPEFFVKIGTYGGGGALLALPHATEVVQSGIVYSWGYWMVGAAVLGRLVFDVVKYIRSQK